MEDRKEERERRRGLALAGRAHCLSLIALLVGALLGAACGSTAPVTDSEQEALYRSAVEDAETAEPSEIVTTLTPIVGYNETLVWRTSAGAERQVLMVTWTDSTSFLDASTGDTLTTEEDVWVTAAPEIRQFCEGVDRSGDQLSLRLAQRLGLPPDVGYDRFVSFWVRPEDLVRPCPDPEVTDRECELASPTPEKHTQVSDAHLAWFHGLEASMYDSEGYPWTRLGYTYDWHPSTDEVGPSEFVVRPEASVEIQSVHTTEAYCRTL